MASTGSLRIAGVFLTAAWAVFSLSSCVPMSDARHAPRGSRTRFVEVGYASWYGMEGGKVKEHGGPTASGRRYDQNALTAAHKTLPLGTRVKVTNLENGRSVVVVINDRGPYIEGRIIDMTLRGARILRFKDAGTARVRIEALP
jgi:rare lipoprotein A